MIGKKSLYLYQHHIASQRIKKVLKNIEKKDSVTITVKDYQRLRKGVIIEMDLLIQEIKEKLKKL